MRGLLLREYDARTAASALARSFRSRRLSRSRCGSRSGTTTRRCWTSPSPRSIAWDGTACPPPSTTATRARFITPAPAPTGPSRIARTCSTIQADMIRLYLDAWTITGAERYRDRARDAWAYVDRTLHDRAQRRLLRQRARRPGRSRPPHRRQRPHDPHAAPRVAAAGRCDAGGNGGAGGRTYRAGRSTGAAPASRTPSIRTRASAACSRIQGACERSDARPRSGLRRSHLPRSLRRADALQPPQTLGPSRGRLPRLPATPPPAPAGRGPARLPVPAVRAERGSGAAAGAARPPDRSRGIPGCAPPTCAGGSTEIIQRRGFRAPRWGLVLLDIRDAAQGRP